MKFFLSSTAKSVSVRLMPFLPIERKRSNERRNALNANREKIARIVCRKEVLEEADNLKEKDGRQAVLLLADALLASFGFFPAVCISVLILRQSLTTWCEKNS